LPTLLWKDGKEDAPLDEKSPLWTDIRIVGGDGKPARALPLKDGYFEVVLPKAFFEGNPKSITLNWIDFYRGRATWPFLQCLLQWPNSSERAKWPNYRRTSSLTR
jgi:hypothetical protein